ncbi:hydrolase 1, exosortase A system-associated [Rugamonas sp.]|uniref:hydrolase 1, exosortase A system-associated n=1 Tax=Rugamonas sp. TaxID=1926287 RepID=UPI0025CDE803|nr:hydrolase 1, exosortase A system-associated [Rugamonas sp.]
MLRDVMPADGAPSDAVQADAVQADGMQADAVQAAVQADATPPTPTLAPTLAPTPADDIALSFNCHGEQLFGVLSPTAAPARRGVLIVVGGPQYRAGSHRQFALLARHLAAQGIPVMRFDYRGMGDSDGAARDFEEVGDDVRCAIDHFFSVAPGLEQVVLWGLCDAASAALFYAKGDPRVGGMVLLNPWARTQLGQARTTLKHYYLQRLMAPELWQKIRAGRFDYGAALRSLLGLLRKAYGRTAPTSASATSAATIATTTATAPAAGAQGDLHQRMLAGWQGFSGPVLLIISGADLTAREFLDMAQAAPAWRRLLGGPRVTRHTLAAADHTFSTDAWRRQVADWTAQWVASW